MHTPMLGKSIGINLVMTVPSDTPIAIAEAWSHGVLLHIFASSNPHKIIIGSLCKCQLHNLCENMSVIFNVPCYSRNDGCGETIGRIEAHTLD